MKKSQDLNISSEELNDSILLDNNHILVSRKYYGLYESNDNGHNFIQLDNQFPIDYTTSKML